MSDKRTYSEKLRDPRWQKRRLEIMQRDKFSCRKCCDDTSTLNVHHRWYERGKEPWESTDECLVTLCERCHAAETEERQAEEARLIRIMRRDFFVDGLRWICDAFHYTRFDCEPEVFAEALDLFLIDPANVQKIVDAWSLHKQDQAEALSEELSPRSHPNAETP
jgi:hypothetical protein